jgi:PAS domain S-box-containing protein
MVHAHRGPKQNVLLAPMKRGKSRGSAEQSGQKFKSLSENLPGAVYEFAFNKDGTYGFKYLSTSIVKMFGIPVKQFMKSFDHIHPEDRARLNMANKHSQLTNEPFYFEGRLITPDGKVKWHSAASSFSYVTASGARVFTGIILDINERKLAEEEIMKSESRLRLALEKVGDNVWEHNYQLRETFLSNTVFKLIGQQPKALKTNVELWSNSIHPDDRHLLEDADKKYRLGQIESHSLEYRVYHANGTIKWVLDRGVVVEKDEHGIPTRVIGTHKDITTRKEMQQEHETAEQHKKKEILQAVLEAHERERQEIANELHENISQSLSSCKLLLDTTMKKKTADDAIIAKILFNIDKAIDELRNISYSLSTSALQLIGLPQALTDLITRVTAKNKVAVYLDANKFRAIKKYNPKVYLTIYRIAQEQLMNIVKHSDATQAHIVLRIVKDKIFIEVSDNGHGFDVSKVKRGLGLTNIFNRAEHYNGKVEIESGPGKGCRLTANMPYK